SVTASTKSAKVMPSKKARNRLVLATPRLGAPRARAQYRPGSILGASRSGGNLFTWLAPCSHQRSRWGYAPRKQQGRGHHQVGKPVGDDGSDKGAAAL